MTLRDAFVLGRDIGFDIGMENRDRYNLRIPSEWDRFYSDCVQTESDHYRQFSPFEFIAKEFNESDDPDAYWTNYEEGVGCGVANAGTAV